MNCRGPQQGDKFMLWVDAVGGYWVCLADTVIVGQPISAAGPTCRSWATSPAATPASAATARDT